MVCQAMGFGPTAYMYPTSRIIPELQQWLMALSSIHVKEVQQEQAVSGTGYAVTGMTSSASFVSGKQVLGTNVDETGDVVFGRSADGNAVQVYMLTTDQGLFAYEITRFNL